MASKSVQKIRRRCTWQLASALVMLILLVRFLWQNFGRRRLRHQRFPGGHRGSSCNGCSRDGARRNAGFGAPRLRRSAA
jgi:hypothetical protein